MLFERNQCILTLVIVLNQVNPSTVFAVVSIELTKGI